jgi:hypothetical protein
MLISLSPLFFASLASLYYIIWKVRWYGTPVLVRFCYLDEKEARVKLTGG